MELLIKSAKVLLDGKLVERDIYVEDGKIVEMGTSLNGKGVNAKGLIALPGIIDAHVHFREPGQTDKEDYLTGSQAAAAGGVTSVLTMPNVRPPTTTLMELENVRELAKRSLVNYGFHFGSTETNLEEIRQVRNIASVKLYLGQSTGRMMVSDATVEKILSETRRVVIHAEDQAIIEKNKEDHAGETAPSVHSSIRTKEAALSALERFFTLKGNASVHVAHASTLDEVRRAKAHHATVEVTPHHLFLNTSHYQTLGTRLKVNPAVRSKEEQALLWRDLDKVDIIATDHAPHLLEEKDLPYEDAPAGLPGVQTLLPLLLDAVNKRRLSLQRLVQLTSERPASIFRMQRKGHLLPGHDADITLVDLRREHTLRDDEQLSRCGWTPYDGWKVTGMPVMTIVGGQVAFEDDKVFPMRGKEITFG
ncbi:MAG: amidohydrolase family protein [DPANN group archaeon]|nr:amidohydrolase family protein [DPANN group archaeon]